MRELEKKLKKKNYTIQQVCNSTGLSRSAILKLEEKGIVKPASVNAKTGYRNYTLIEIAAILQYRMLREMDLSMDEILAYFSNRSHITELIERMETYSFQLNEEVVTRGLRQLATEKLFAIRDGTRELKAAEPNAPYEATICIPIADSNISSKNDERYMGYVEKIPGGHMFSMLCHWNYDGVTSFHAVFERFWKEVARRRLIATGPMRNIGVVAPYVGVDIDAKDFVFRFTVPVREALEDEQ
ncbi:MAG: MerR family transcriptional regulator [Lachnospiraceae bacterium]|nr:MerR family transcriptional regulator [Lachnospiraceae bacterium]